MVTMSKRYPPEVREKAVRLALDHVDEYGSAYAAAHAIGPMVDVHPETLRVWLVKARNHRAGGDDGRRAEHRHRERDDDAAEAAHHTDVVALAAIQPEQQMGDDEQKERDDVVEDRIASPRAGRFA
jgi:transposase-like protein